ncbi:hypothetical protein V1264_011525 [Littorina saxatilis]|uniref:Uncharacterized protein n=1 Tax=Littorina saxatilis TaxID=31220 RepID=A0AAN9BV85_9CAEN
MLSGAYNDTVGFQSVSIKRFWKGSLGVDFTIKYNYSAVRNTDKLQEQLNSTVREKLSELPRVDKAHLNKTLSENIAKVTSTLRQVEQNPCSSEASSCSSNHECRVKADKKHVLCISPCTNYGCGGGTCFLDSGGQPKCRCPKGDTFVYVGEHCDERAEKLPLTSRTIIAIAVGVGALVVSLSLALFVVCFRRLRRTQSKDNLHRRDSEYSDTSIRRSKVGSDAPSRSSFMDVQARHQNSYRRQPRDVASLITPTSGDFAESMEMTSYVYPEYEDRTLPCLPSQAILTLPWVRHDDVRRHTMTSGRDDAQVHRREDMGPRSEIFLRNSAYLNQLNADEMAVEGNFRRKEHSYIQHGMRQPQDL